MCFGVEGENGVMVKIKRHFFILMMMSFLAACNSTAPQDTPAGTSARVAPAARAPASAAQRTDLSFLPTAEATENYRIMPTDKLDVSVFQIPDLDRSVEVNQSGMISLPLIGLVHAAGMTTDQLQKDIERRLAADYIQHPQVTVSVKEYSNRRITVTGQVNRPGVFPFARETTLMQAIALGGGFTSIADMADVFVFRTSGHTRQVARFDVQNISNGLATDPMLQAGDVIVVDTSTSRVVMRDIRDLVPIAGLFIALAKW